MKKDKGPTRGLYPYGPGWMDQGRGNGTGERYRHEI